MSDKIKQKYISYMNEENPSEEFLSSLTERLKLEEKRVRPKKNPFVISGAIAAGIAACIAVPLAISLNRAPLPVEKAPLDYAGTVNASAIDAKPLENLGDFSEITAKTLSERICGSLSELLESESNGFVDAKNVDEKKRRELIEKLAAAVETNETPSGKQTFYMAVFEDGEIVKFSVFENGVVTINGSAKRFL